MDADRPVEPDEARAHGNDPDAVEIRDGGSGEQGSTGYGPRGGETDPEGHHLTDPDAGTNRATTDAGQDTPQGPAGQEQEGWDVPSGSCLE
jgi:hypothetical protein